MPNNFYGTSAALGWVLAHYFYGGKHFSWLAIEYYPYRLPNPKSSNPHLIYQDLYQPWRDRDDFDKMISQTRINVRKGVMGQEKFGALDPSLAARLKDVCDNIDIVFFYPLVYRVDVDTIPPSRKRVAGSGLVGSHECLVPDLEEHEFDLLFLDYSLDRDFKTLVTDEAQGISTTSSVDALTILESRC
jgi:hypothetical protein